LRPASDVQIPTSAPGFAEAAAVGDLYEVESSRLATMKASSPEVRQFAEMMIADHTASTEQLKQIIHGDVGDRITDAARRASTNAVE
jgi:predicted outer membrane protein